MSMVQERKRNASREAMDVICLIIEAAGGTLVTKKRLHKAFYKAHLEYMRQTGDDLTFYPIVKLEKGPGIDQCDSLILQLIDESRISRRIGTIELPKAEVYTLLEPCKKSLDEFAMVAIKEATDWVVSHGPNQLTHLSHLRSWYEAGMGKEQQIELDLLEGSEIDRIRERAGELYEALLNHTSEAI